MYSHLMEECKREFCIRGYHAYKEIIGFSC